MEIQEIDRGDGLIEVQVGERRLTCTVCGHQQFHERNSLLNTRAATFFKVIGRIRKRRTTSAPSAGTSSGSSTAADLFRMRVERIQGSRLGVDSVLGLAEA